MIMNNMKSILPRLASAAAAAAAVFWLASGGALASEDTSEEDVRTRAYERIAKEAAKTIGEAEEEAESQMREAMKNPEGKDAIITTTGKMLRRSDGRWLTPDGENSDEGTFTIAFTGDVIFDRGQNPWAASAYSDGIESCFDEDSWALMHDADVLVVNNEFAYTDRGSAISGKKFTFRCPPDTVDWLKEMGTDLAALANNHIYDYGEEGILDTFDTLDGAEIPYIGAGRDLEDAHKPAYCIVNGTVVAILNATEIERYENPETREAEEDSPGVFRCLDDEDLCDKVREAKKKADLCIVFVHWGTELMPAAEESQIEKAQDLVEAGADLIIGAHPHVLQNIQYVDDVPVFYSLGNYFFSASTRDSGIVRVTVDTDGAKISALQFVPMQQRQGVKMLYDGEKERVLDTMRDLSPGVLIDDDGYFEQE